MLTPNIEIEDTPATSAMCVPVGWVDSPVEGVDSPMAVDICSLIEAAVKLEDGSTTPWECVESCCRKRFPTKSRMADHYRSVHGKKGKVCPCCEKKFAYPCDVQRHYKASHWDEPPLEMLVRTHKKARKAKGCGDVSECQ
jgi:hypothetical protein